MAEVARWNQMYTLWSGRPWILVNPTDLEMPRSTLPETVLSPPRYAVGRLADPDR